MIWRTLPRSSPARSIREEVDVMLGSATRWPEDNVAEAWPRGVSRQLVVALAETGKAHWEADTFFRCLENNEGRALAGTKFLDEFVVHDNFGDASVGQATHETRPSDIRLIDLEPQS